MTDSSPTVFDLLTEALITTRSGGENTKRSLPGVLEVLGAEQDVTFPALRRHQKHAWHAFLVQQGKQSRCRRPTGGKSCFSP